MPPSHSGPEVWGNRVSVHSSVAPTYMRTTRCSPNLPAALWEAELEPDLVHMSVLPQKTTSLYEYSRKLFSFLVMDWDDCQSIKHQRVGCFRELHLW